MRSAARPNIAARSSSSCSCPDLPGSRRRRGRITEDTEEQRRAEESKNKGVFGAAFRCVSMRVIDRKGTNTLNGFLCAPLFLCVLCDRNQRPALAGAKPRGRPPPKPPTRQSR